MDKQLIERLAMHAASRYIDGKYSSLGAMIIDVVERIDAERGKEAVADAEVEVIDVYANSKGKYHATVVSDERLSVGAELFLAPQIPEGYLITEDLVTRLRAMSSDSIGDDAVRAIEGLIVQKEQAYELGKTDGWEACETCHGIVGGKLPVKQQIPEGMALVPIDRIEKLLEYSNKEYAPNEIFAQFKAMIAAAGVAP